jgi:hypothetical protein
LINQEAIDLFFVGFAQPPLAASASNPLSVRMFHSPKKLSTSHARAENLPFFSKPVSIL